MSPAGLYQTYAVVWDIYQQGYINGNRVYSEYSIRPVIVLSENVLVTTGNGTSTDPFVIE